MRLLDHGLVYYSTSVTFWCDPGRALPSCCASALRAEADFQMSSWHVWHAMRHQKVTTATSREVFQSRRLISQGLHTASVPEVPFSFTSQFTWTFEVPPFSMSHEISFTDLHVTVKNCHSYVTSHELSLSLQGGDASAQSQLGSFGCFNFQA